MALQAGFEHAPAGQAAAIFADDSVPDRFFFRREVSRWRRRDCRRWRGDGARSRAVNAECRELSGGFFAPLFHGGTLSRLVLIPQIFHRTCLWCVACDAGPHVFGSTQRLGPPGPRFCNWIGSSFGEHPMAAAVYHLPDFPEPVRVLVRHVPPVFVHYVVDVCCPSRDGRFCASRDARFWAGRARPFFGSLLSFCGLCRVVPWVRSISWPSIEIQFFCRSRDRDQDD